MADPFDPAKLLPLAKEALDRLDFSGAVEILIKVPSSPERDILLARAHRQTARPHDAKRLVDPLVNTHADAAAERGLLAMHTESHEAARAYFEGALGLGGTLDAINGLAVIEEAQTKGTNARALVYALLDRGLARYPEHHMLVQTLGIALLNDGRIAEAREAFAKVITLRAEPPWAGTRFEVEAHGNMACALVAAGELEAALESVERTMEVCPQWFRQGMAMAMKQDPDLAPIHESPEFIASMNYQRGGTRAERIAEAKATLAAREAGPEPLPDPDELDAAVRSGEPDRVDAACEIIHALVEAREALWEDHGWCDERIRRCAEAVIERSLRAVDWLDQHLLDDPSSSAMALAALLLGSYDADLQPVGASLALTLFERFVADDVDALGPLVETLSFPNDRGDPAELPDVRPFLLAIACREDASAYLRCQAIEALVLQRDPRYAAELAPLVSDDAVAPAVIAAVHSLDASKLDPTTLLSSPATRRAAGLHYAAELAPDHTDTLLEIFAETTSEVEYERSDLLRALLPHVDERFVDAVIDYSCEPDAAWWCLGWMREQRLSDAQLERLMATRFDAKRAPHWLAGVARGQARRLRFDSERVAMLAPLDAMPDEGSAQLVGYLGLEDRVPWLRERLGTADRRATAGIVVALGIVGDETDIPLLRHVGEQISFLQANACLGRVLLGDDPRLLDDVVVNTPDCAWALERLIERDGPSRLLAGVAARASERGLHNEDLAEFQRVMARVRAALGL